MVTIVIKDESVSPEDIRAYIEKEQIEGEYEVITQEEYNRRKAAEPVYDFKLPPSIDDLLPGMGLIDITAAAQEAERKERKFKKQQQKYAQRFASRRGWK